MKAVIVSGGKAPSEKILKNAIKNASIIIGADKGCEVLLKNNITPSYILGDFDSASKETILKFENLGVPKTKFKEEKDFTDTTSAFNLAIDKGCTEILLLGATGTRYDHVLGNIGLLLKAIKLDIKAEIIDDNNRIYLINKNCTLYGNYGDTISFQAYSKKVIGLTIKGSKYNLYNYDLEIGDSLTVSNEFLDSPIEISFKNGPLMVLYTND
ncbi:thiamine diphosphokinase [Clostridium septicum]|uniref:Thiamine diphosphokinase n=1 Tax=Clostridium septicum TaxID=1504 RepID=A0A9N7JJ05_CLOSE|nr:thiamine diphosphokinase [Clostridium septicum]AYE33115.1 thiamine diphosphokinase [Clostridium septicum]MDU1313477.1 thiamine diphosphokinase [Clostridium septicum]QAS61285.1 thiamine diphosphokinase [Clostridium septicum]UEC19364.1 thiamine diphosphokinase [Clostridium septicum]USR99683.1 thiamine diphosphokinase [Clostridium septicum]